MKFSEIWSSHAWSGLIFALCLLAFAIIVCAVSVYHSCENDIPSAAIAAKMSSMGQQAVEIGMCPIQNGKKNKLTTHDVYQLGQAVGMLRTLRTLSPSTQSFNKTIKGNGNAILALFEKRYERQLLESRK